MDYHILSLIPQVFEGYFASSILGRAQQAGLIRIQMHQLRDFAQDKHQSVDDRPYGGGAGMVFRPEVVVDAVRTIKKDYGVQHVVLTSPRGKLLNHDLAKSLVRHTSILLICGRYEGVDQRAIDLVVDEEISIGDYVITGGELAAQIIVDVTARLLPHVIGHEEGPVQDSFADGLLEHPHYTRPAEFEGMKVPEVLLQGNHEAIRQWRKEESLKITQKCRPDLMLKNKRINDDS